MNKNLYPWIAVILVAALFVFVEAPGLIHQEPGDEWVYFEMSRLVASGTLPYRDFFYAHPPLQLIVYSLPSHLGVWALKLIPLLSILGTGILVFLMARRYGNLAGVLASWLFFSSSSILFEATYGTGACETTFLTALGIYLFIKKKPISGVILALACLMRSYALVPTAVVLGLSLVKKQWKVIIGFSVCYIVPIAFLSLLFPSFFSSIFLYHAAKSGGSALPALGDIALRNLPLLIGALLIFLTTRRVYPLFWMIPLFYIIFLLSLGRVFSFYAIVIVPYITILGGAGLATFWGSKKILKAVVVIGLVVSGFLFISNSLDLRKNDFAPFTDILSEIQGKSIFGNDGTVSMLAYQKGLPICENFIDTNDQRFISGSASVSDAVMTLRGCDLVVLRPLTGLGSVPEVLAAAEQCSLLRRFDDPLRGTFLVFRCGSGTS